MRPLAASLLLIVALAAAAMAGMTLVKREYLPGWVILGLWVGGGLWFAAWGLVLLVVIKVMIEY